MIKSRALAACIGLALHLQPVPASGGELLPNVLMIVVDDLNTHVGAYGYQAIDTPNMDRLAARGVTFSRAYAQYPQCNQSRASLLASQYPDQLQVLTLEEPIRHAQPDLVTLPQHFRQNGYFTARVGKVFHQGVPPEIGQDGLDDPLSWDVAINPAGVDIRVDDRIESIAPPDKEDVSFGGMLSWLALDSDEAHTDEIGAQEAIRLLREHHPDRTGQPLFLALGFYRPHTPYVAPRQWFERYPPASVELAEVPPGDRENKPLAALADRPHQLDMTELQKRQAIQGYHAAVSFVDEQLGKVIDALDRSGIADDTLVLFVSDHGYQLGSHGLWQKKDLFENSVRTPMILVAPGRIAPKSRLESVVELVDVYPTLVALAGLEPPQTPIMGRNLMPVIEGREAGRRSALSQSRSMAHLVRPERRGMNIMGYTLRTDRYRYTEWGRGEEGVELYDYVVDPLEYSNLAGDPAYAAVQDQLRSLLDHRLDAIHGDD